MIDLPQRGILRATYRSAPAVLITPRSADDHRRRMNAMRSIRIPLHSTKYPNLSIEIDADDADRVGQHHWNVKPGRTTFYAHTTIKRSGLRTTMTLHRFLMDADLGDIVDHINHDGLDCRRSNLRICTLDQNGANRRGPDKSNKCGYIGVHFHKRFNRFCAGVSCKGKLIHLGYFDTPIEAARVRDRAALELYGEFATLNFPEELGVEL